MHDLKKLNKCNKNAPMSTTACILARQLGQLDFKFSTFVLPVSHKEPCQSVLLNYTGFHDQWAFLTYKEVAVRERLSCAEVKRETTAPSCSEKPQNKTTHWEFTKKIMLECVQCLKPPGEVLSHAEWVVFFMWSYPWMAENLYYVGGRGGKQSTEPYSANLSSETHKVLLCVVFLDLC